MLVNRQVQVKMDASFFQMATVPKPKSEMTEQELLALEEAEFQNGPMSLLTQVLFIKIGSQEPFADSDHVQVT